MKFSAYLIVFSLFLSQCSSGSVSEYCMEASEFDRGLSYDFCVAFLSNWQPPSSNLEDYWVNSIQLTKSNGTNMLSVISKLLDDKSIDEHMKGGLNGCFDSYNDTISELDAAVVAFKAKDFDTAGTKVSESLDTPIACELLFANPTGGNSSPLTTENNAYFKLNVIPLVVLQILKHSS
ncbi:hypothetical protein VNO80_21325 [Phaseolus coccineus]|uniref:Pectinesterase inhibitor domain-containing protein n=1 Tax=Phaseolus coccineus TaxID=3886 RepID=A0AAN9QSZ3_PHACN